MNETSPAVLTLDKEDAVRKAGSSGQPVMHTEVRIVRPDGSDAGVDELGELWVRGPNVTPGYWNRPDANASSFTDGWLHTGDATRVDAEGFYYIVDRWKDMYISGGENVYPAEVENVLHQIPAIAEAAFIGIPSEQWGEVGMAIVPVKPRPTLSPHHNQTHCSPPPLCRCWPRKAPTRRRNTTTARPTPKSRSAMSRPIAARLRPTASSARPKKPISR